MDVSEYLSGVPDMVAFLTARKNDDYEAAQAIMDNPDVDMAGVLLDLTDLNLALVEVVSKVIGTTPDEFLQTMGRVGGMISAGIIPEGLMPDGD